MAGILDFIRSILNTRQADPEVWESGTIGVPVVRQGVVPGRAPPMPPVMDLGRAPLEPVDVQELSMGAPQEPVEVGPLAEPVPVPVLPPLPGWAETPERRLQRLAPHIYGYPGEAFKGEPMPLTLPDLPKSIDWDFLSDREGGILKVGYVPKDPDRGIQSGVTIGAGVDLGQMNTRDFGKLELDPNLAKKLAPYLGVRGKAAQALLAKKPLRLTDEEAEAVTLARKKLAYDNISRNLEREGIELDTLPGEIQTAVASLGYHMGPNIPAHSPRFTAALKKGVETNDFSDVVFELRNFGKQHMKNYGRRRKMEADLVQSWIEKKKT